MVSSNTASDISDDDAAPENVSLSQSRADVKRHDITIQNAEYEVKRKEKEKNRRKDENLKRRAEETRGSRNRGGTSKGRERESTQIGGSGGAERPSLEDRMERAMREAQDEETGSDEEGIDDSGESDGVSQMLDESDQDDEGVSTEDASNDMDGIEEKEGLGHSESFRRLMGKGKSLDYLPEHVFAAALSRARLPRDGPTPATKPAAKSVTEQNRKKRRMRTMKDLVVGSKTIRTVTSKAAVLAVSAASRTVPPGKVRRFFESQLGLKAGRFEKRQGSSERKAAHIGSLRSSNFPAASFVRNR